MSVLGVLAAQAKEDIFTYEQLAEKAAVLANGPYEAGRRQPAPAKRKMTYDQYRNIRFNPRKAVWYYDHIPFQVQLFHPGWIQDDRVGIHLIQGGHVTDLEYSPKYFDFGTNAVDEAEEAGLAFSGFRIHYPLNRQDYLDELAVFQGATYFRALAKGLAYGLSARAAAVNCGGPGPEEFPRFTDFWLAKPRDEKERSIRVLGLFDGPSLTGAAEFTLTPGEATAMRCRVTVCARKRIERLGIAPLTSMFWYGRQCGNRFPDFRPEVHDSDGLLVHNGAGEWLWRPLANEKTLRLCSFVDQTPKGFGLMQRDREFASYEDLEARYQDRPSAWVAPVGDWGKGSVKLVEIPTPNEFNDNIVAYWQPAEPMEAAQSREFVYDLQWFADNPALPASGRVKATRISDVPDTEDYDRVADGKTALRKFVLDYAWPGIEDAASREKLEADVSASRAELVGKPVQQYNAFDKTLRVFFKVQARKGGEAADLRVNLLRGGKPVAESWIYLWNP